MKLITKKCPNCGASLSISEEDKKVTCEYCKQELLIERDRDAEVQLHLLKTGKKIFNTVAFCIVLIVIFSMIMFTFIFLKIFNFGESQFKENNPIDSPEYNNPIDIPIEMPEDNTIKDISEISKEQLEIYHQESLKKLEERKIFLSSNIKSTNWKYYGTYFLKHKRLDTNEMYDVFMKTYTVGGKNITAYAPVMYSNLELIDGEVISFIPGFVNIPVDCIYSKGSTCISGYENIETLYRELIHSNKGDYIISSTEGTYVK